MAKKGKDLKFDDTLQCCFYSRKTYCKKEMEHLSLSINETISALSHGYIWHRDEFRVCSPLKLDGNNSVVELLTSVTCFGDNIEDEWFIVYLVYELTKLNDDLIVHLEDSDGCFLLIEAADYLPKWLNPDNAEHRVFIYQNNIHILHPDILSLDKEVDVYNAVNLIADNPEKTKASSEIQTAIRKRIYGYPQKIEDNTHKAIVSLPIEVASILKLKPSLISPLVNTYCNHDMFEEKICRTVNFKHCINVQITFTKYLYAMLLNSHVAKGILQKVQIPEKEKNKTLGFKLTCGYEIIMNQSSKDVFTSIEYKKFLNSLTKKGYFKDNIEDSKVYNQLLEKAKSYYLTMECPMNTHIYNAISSLMTEESFQNMKNFLLHNDNSELSEDDDNWLNITPDQLNDVLTRYGNKVTIKNEDTSQNITYALTEFLKKNSDFEGIERTAEDLHDNKIEFDPEQFSNCLEKYLNIVTSNDNLEISDDDEYSEVEDDISEKFYKELISKLCYLPKTDNNTIKDNLVQSMKEEGLSGPSSNVLKTIGFNKTDLLDSDDDA